jgi:hypothetical protein
MGYHGIIVFQNWKVHANVVFSFVQKEKGE